MLEPIQSFGRTFPKGKVNPLYWLQELSPRWILLFFYSKILQFKKGQRSISLSLHTPVTITLVSHPHLVKSWSRIAYYRINKSWINAVKLPEYAIPFIRKLPLIQLVSGRTKNFLQLVTKHTYFDKHSQSNTLDQRVLVVWKAVGGFGVDLVKVEVEKIPNHFTPCEFGIQSYAIKGDRIGL